MFSGSDSSYYEDEEAVQTPAASDGSVQSTTDQVQPESAGH